MLKELVTPLSESNMWPNGQPVPKGGQPAPEHCVLEVFAVDALTKHNMDAMEIAASKKTLNNFIVQMWYQALWL